jgi:WD40 repeat protein
VVAVSLRGGAIELRALADGRLLETLRWHGAGVRTLAWAGPVLVTGDTDGTLAVWDLPDLSGDR